MKEIVFITGNDRKVAQAKECLKRFDIQVTVEDLDMDEIQSHDPLLITKAKAEAAFQTLQKPLVVCDHSWNFKALNGFPGGYMKDINGWFKAEDFIALMRDKDDKSVALTETVWYIDEKTSQNFSVDIVGQFITEPRGTGYVPAERVVVLDGEDKTIAEFMDAGQVARNLEKSAWMPFGEWFSKQ